MADWIQLDDYTTNGATTGYPTGWTSEYVGTPVARTADPVIESNAVLANAASAFASTSGGASNDPQHFVGLWEYDTVADEVTWYAGSRAGYLRFLPNLTPPSSIIPPTPPGAIGYEWAEPSSAVAAAEAIWSLRTLFATGANMTVNYEAQVGYLTDQVTVPDPDAPMITLATLTQAADAAEGSAALTVTATGDVTFLGRYTEAIVTTAGPLAKFNPQTGWARSFEMNVGAPDGSNSVIGVEYTLTPPLFRWIYPYRRRIAHNRGVQRGSDGQGVTGGKRGLQRTSRQSSLRGGSFL